MVEKYEMTNDARYQRFSSYLKLEVGLGDASIARYLEIIKRFYGWHLERTEIPKGWREFSEDDVRDYILALEPAPSYANLVISSLSRFFRFQRDVLKERTDDPTALLNRPKKSKHHPPALEPSEVQGMMVYAYQHSARELRLRNWALIGFLYGTGVRISEACGLKVSSIRYQDELPYAITVVGKGDKERTVVLSDTAKVALYKWLKFRKALVLELPPSAELSYVWLNPVGRYQGQHVKPPAVRKMLKEVSEGALGKHVHPHMLRHTFITQAVRSGAPLHAIQAAAGHADLSTTGMYMHADERDVAGVAAGIPDLG